MGTFSKKHMPARARIMGRTRDDLKNPENIIDTAIELNEVLSNYLSPQALALENLIIDKKEQEHAITEKMIQRFLVEHYIASEEEKKRLMLQEVMARLRERERQAEMNQEYVEKRQAETKAQIAALQNEKPINVKEFAKDLVILAEELAALQNEKKQYEAIAQQIEQDIEENIEEGRLINEGIVDYIIIDLSEEERPVTTQGEAYTNDEIREILTNAIAKSPTPTEVLMQVLSSYDQYQEDRAEIIKRRQSQIMELSITPVIADSELPTRENVQLETTNEVESSLASEPPPAPEPPPALQAPNFRSKPAEIKDSVSKQILALGELLDKEKAKPNQDLPEDTGQALLKVLLSQDEAANAAPTNVNENSITRDQNAVTKDNTAATINPMLAAETKNQQKNNVNFIQKIAVAAQAFQVEDLEKFKKEKAKAAAAPTTVSTDKIAEPNATNMAQQAEAVTQQNPVTKDAAQTGPAPKDQPASGMDASQQTPTPKPEPKPSAIAQNIAKGVDLYEAKKQNKAKLTEVNEKIAAKEAQAELDLPVAARYAVPVPKILEETSHKTAELGNKNKTPTAS